ncbi:MAG: histidine triad nucleotide-binding protein [Oscillospiraceae bacterium]|jgi:histidine triad (HIT) family protein|nr:histidine triad nucleotide-binding protein [Oscillospiraceae bacterium]
MTDCIFCKIINGEIPSDRVYSDENVYAFRDINPKAETHVLVVPRKHIVSAADITAENSADVAYCFEAIAKIAAQERLSDFCVISSSGRGAGQTVFHLHFHILSERGLGERLKQL